MGNAHHLASLRELRLIGVSSGIGAPAGSAWACAQGPEALRRAGLAAAPGHDGCRARWDRMLSPGEGQRQAVVAELLGRLADRVADVISEGAVPVVIGGDHSIAAGTWRGAGRAGSGLGLLWLDAHLDAHTPETSPSGNLHGMPLAALLGAGPAELVGVAGPLLDPRHVCVVGARSFEADEMRFLRAMGVRIFEIEDIRRRGLAAVLAEALAWIRRGTAGFGVSIDLDVVDPLDAPGVNTPAPDGIDGGELCAALRGLVLDPQLVALEIAEFNPARDGGQRTARLAVTLLEALCAPAGEELVALDERYGAHNYAPLPVVLARGAGVYVWDVDGRRYIDMMSAYSAASFGHGHPRLVAALSRQAERLAVTSRAYYNDRLPLLLKRLAELFGYEAALPVNTGLEAVETAIKAARKWAYRVKGVAADSAEIIACAGNFHGRSTTIVGLSAEPQYRDGFGPYPAGLKCIAYGDAAALEAAITPTTAAVLVEPIQGEGGIVVPPPGYLAACAAICRRNNVLLLCDEVQTGLGRTGRLLASWHEQVRPDGVMLGKALGGGLLPVSAFLADRRVMDVFTPGDHGSTFGGNALAAAVALEALDLIVEEDLAQRSATLGAYLLARLSRIRSPLIREVRGRGLFIGIEIDPRYTDARTVCVRLLEHGVLSKDTHGTVVRIAPPLIIERDEIDQAVLGIAAALARIEQELPRAA